MTKRVQILGHTAELANQFVGLERELTLDDDNAEIRIHDGTTPGGRHVLDRDANDERYQARSVELDGLLGWEPNQRGFPVRRGPQTYSLRSLTVNDQQLTVTNPNGYNGNPLFGIAATITTNHTFSGSITFSEAITADGGLDGETRGIHTGNVAGNLTGNVDGNLVGDTTGNHAGPTIGDVDVRGHTLLLADGQILLDMLSPAIIAAIVDSGLPVGAIVAYSGLLVDIPANWDICDGTNGTPDLRGRFILGVSPDYALFDTGGSYTHAHSVESGDGTHTHSGAVDDHALTLAELPTHYHYQFTATDGAYGTLVSNPEHSPSQAAHGGSSGASYNIGADGTLDAQLGRSSEIGAGDAHSHGLTLASGGGHTHTATSSTESSLPPYMALVYIRKGA